ncbi:MAG: hypothetical protein WBM23_10590 [Desulfomonilia bacterium]|jgi:hypothetical protein
MDITEVKYLFEKEFGVHRNKFEIYDLPLAEAENSREQHIWKPGVYVFWHPTRGVIKVGRHFTNSRKRAFEHLRDNTGGVMTALRDDQGTRLLLFNVKESEDKHWVAALEVYFEEQLSPEVKSGRLG